MSKTPDQIIKSYYDFCRENNLTELTEGKDWNDFCLYQKISPTIDNKSDTTMGISVAVAIGLFILLLFFV